MQFIVYGQFCSVSCSSSRRVTFTNFDVRSVTQIVILNFILRNSYKCKVRINKIVSFRYIKFVFALFSFQYQLSLFIEKKLVTLPYHNIGLQIHPIYQVCNPPIYFVILNEGYFILCELY